MSITAAKWLSYATLKLEQAGDPDARYEARCMLSDACRLPLYGVTLSPEMVLEESSLDLAERWLRMRLTGMPLQYVQGFADFMGHRFQVNSHVLIPRQDSELLCELAIEYIRSRRMKVLDLCCGSGALGLSILSACPHIGVWLTDISDKALAVAKQNTRYPIIDIGLEKNVVYAQGDFFDAVPNMVFDVIVCNPPYLTKQDMQNLQKEVTFEPAIALEGGEDGLLFYRRAARETFSHLTPGGHAFFEVGAGQAPEVISLFGQGKTHKDLLGIDRVVEIVKPMDS